MTIKDYAILRDLAKALSPRSRQDPVFVDLWRRHNSLKRMTLIYVARSPGKMPQSPALRRPFFRSYEDFFKQSLFRYTLGMTSSSSHGDRACCPATPPEGV